MSLSPGFYVVYKLAEHIQKLEYGDWSEEKYEAFLESFTPTTGAAVSFDLL